MIHLNPIAKRLTRGLTKSSSEPMLLISNLLGQRVIVEPKPGWVGDGGEMVGCEGVIRAVALDRGFAFIVQSDDGRLNLVQTITHDIWSDQNG